MKDEDCLNGSVIQSQSSLPKNLEKTIDKFEKQEEQNAQVVQKVQETEPVTQ